MYKILLTWRYLLTRYIALVSVISVTLGVATMIVVNAVMLGFSREMENRIHGALSDVTISSRSSLRGFNDVDTRIKDAWKVAGDMIEAITPTVTTPGLMSFELPGNEVITRQVQIVGIDEVTHEKVTAVSQYLQHPENRKKMSFDLRESGYDIQNPLFGDQGTERLRMKEAGWIQRRRDAKYEKYRREDRKRQKEILNSLPSYPSTDSMDGMTPGPENQSLDGSAMALRGKSEEGSPATDPYAAVLGNLPKEPPDYTETESESPVSEGLPPETSDGAGDSEFSGGGVYTPNVLSGPDPEITPGGADENSRGPEVSAVDDFEKNSQPEPFTRGTPFDGMEEFEPQFDKETQQATGVIVGMGLVSGFARKVIDPDTGKEVIRESLLMIPGQDVTLSFLAVGSENMLPSIVYDRFTITDLYECRMNEYDEMFVYVPIDKLQTLRRMVMPDGTKLATHLLIKAKPGVKIEELRDKLQESEEFPQQLYEVETWLDQQAPMLSAVAVELSILNVLLFLTIAVAGFGILAIFFMIVVEKTKDIGILKSLGASGFGIMQIFLFYSLALGIVGAGFGLILGLWFVHHIQNIAHMLSKIMGHEVFDPTIYMFHQVPAIVEPMTVFWIVSGAVFIAVISGILPAIRAARLKPVDALRV